MTSSNAEAKAEEERVRIKLISVQCTKKEDVFGSDEFYYISGVHTEGGYGTENERRGRGLTSAPFDIKNGETVYFKNVPPPQGEAYPSEKDGVIIFDENVNVRDSVALAVTFLDEDFRVKKDFAGTKYEKLARAVSTSIGTPLGTAAGGTVGSIAGPVGTAAGGAAGGVIGAAIFDAIPGTLAKMASKMDPDDILGVVDNTIKVADLEGRKEGAWNFTDKASFIQVPPKPDDPNPKIGRKQELKKGGIFSGWDYTVTYSIEGLTAK